MKIKSTLKFIKWVTLRAFKKEPIGLKDINGLEIREGDEISVHSKIDQRNEEWGFLVDTARQDPLAWGIVTWDETALAWVVKYTWKCPQWDNGAPTCLLGGSGYAYQIYIPDFT